VTAVRAATVGDLAAIAALDRASTPEREAFLRNLLTKPQGVLFVAVDGDLPGAPVVGYVAMEAGAFFGRDFIELLVVAETHRRQGVGALLLSSARAAAANARVFTSTNESNAPMRALLASDGWTLSGRLTGLDDGDPELVFYRDQ
jgi:GNAT superfamily N-acetyltransferase